MFLEHQINISKRFLKDHGTLKNGVMADVCCTMQYGRKKNAIVNSVEERTDCE